MKRCLELAGIAKANGKTAVGSLVVKQGQIIAEGTEGDQDLPSVLAHAEILAVTKALKYVHAADLSDCILYTTVEPCFMCSYVIRQTKIREVVYGVATPGTGGISSAYPILSVADIDAWPSLPMLTGGILGEDCLELLKS